MRRRIWFALALCFAIALPGRAAARADVGYGGPDMNGLGNLHDGSASGSGNVDLALYLGFGIGVACGLLAAWPARWWRGFALALGAAAIAGLLHGAAWFAFRIVRGFHAADQDPGNAWGTTALVFGLLLVQAISLALPTAVAARAALWGVQR